MITIDKMASMAYIYGILSIESLKGNMSMSNQTVSVSLRLPIDAHEALNNFATKEGITVTDALLQAVYAFLQGKDTTDPAASARMAAEDELAKAVLTYAQIIRESEYDADVTMKLFDWIKNNHDTLYDRAIGQNAEHAYRINPQIAKRFAYAIGATPVLNQDGKPAKVYLERNANKLIQSYTKLKKA
tara:strand:+ start:180 stop:740 length:561 start_codon:yes stop_codon:yes gene_type:complete